MSDTELQQARRMWLDAERRLIEAEASNVRLQKIIFELQQKLMQQAVDHVVDHMSAPWVAMAAEMRRSAR